MIRGKTDADRKPWLTVRVMDAGGILHPVKFHLDTGFGGRLTLPPDVIEQLGLTPDVDRTIVLAHEQSVTLRDPNKKRISV